MTDEKPTKIDEPVHTHLHLSGGGCLAATIALILVLMTCSNWWVIGAALRRWLET